MKMILRVVRGGGDSDGDCAMVRKMIMKTVNC